MTDENTNTQGAGTPSPDTTTTPAGNAEVDSGAAESSQSESWVTEDVRKAMDFDPFTPEEDEPKPEETTNPDGSPSADGGQEAQPASVTQAKDQTGGTPTEVAKPAPQTYTQEQVDHLLNAVRTGATQPKPIESAQQAAPQDALTVMPEYEYNIPDQLMASLNSEDPVERKQAMAGLIKGVARGIHQTLATAVIARLTTLEQNLPTQIGSYVTQSQQAQHVSTDFYGKFPQLNVPELRPLVQSIAQAHMEATGQKEWTDKLRDEIGNLVIAKLAGAIPAAPAQAQPAAAQPAMFGGNSAAGNVRVQARPGPKTQADHMADIFD